MDNPPKAQFIFVNLDETLVRTEVFLESVFRFLKYSPFNVLRMALWLAHGIHYAKERVSRHVDIDVEELPLEESLIHYLNEQRQQGRCLVLATATHRKYAETIAAHLGIFDKVLATDATRHLHGRNKLAAIHEVAGDSAFAYAGTSAADDPVFRAASANIFVNGPRSCVDAARAAEKLEKIIASRPPQWRAFLKEMRLHQYAKNALIFVPLLTSHEYLSAPALVASLLAFVLFGLCASGVYFLNDLLDLPFDRRHRSKQNRPLASGNLALHMGVLGAVSLPAIAFAVSLAVLPAVFALVLFIYFFVANAYSMALKRISTADVMTLAILYTLRVIAGSAATGIALSSWLLAFSVFAFVSLGYLKRYVEVTALTVNDKSAPGRGYSGADSETMFSLGIANITASVLILALYINSNEVSNRYQTPELLWLLCLLMLYWGNRIWVGARRGKIADDPVVFAIRDKVSRMVGVVFIVILLAARYYEF